MSIHQVSAPPDTPFHAIVAGAGITGLTAAYELRKRGLRVLVLEASDRPGGLIHTTHADGFTIEAGPDSLLAQKPSAIELCRELGLDAELQSVRPPGGAFVLRGRTLYRLPSPSILGLPVGWRALLHYDLLPAAARARLALEPLIPPRQSTDDESVASFFRRRFGPATVGLVAQPLLGGIHAGDIEQLSMQALFPRLLEIERTRGHILSLRAPASSPRAQFVSLKGGMSALVDALMARVGDAVVLNAPVRSLTRAGHSWRLSLPAKAGSDTSFSEARAIILATPAYVAADLLAPIAPEAARLCAEVPYVSTASVALAWRRDDVPHPLTGTGFVVARSHSDVRITACTWISSKWEHRAPDGTVLLRAFLGGMHDPGVVDLADDEIVAVARRDLQATMGIAAAPLLTRVFRWRRAGAQHTVGQLARVDAIDASLSAHPGLFVAGSGFRSVGIPDCVSDARAVAARAYTMFE